MAARVLSSHVHLIVLRPCTRHLNMTTPVDHGSHPRADWTIVPRIRAFYPLARGKQGTCIECIHRAMYPNKSSMPRRQQQAGPQCRARVKHLRFFSSGVSRLQLSICLTDDHCTRVVARILDAIYPSNYLLLVAGFLSIAGSCGYVPLVL